MADNFFDVAQAIGELEYDINELNYFIKHGFCRSGKTSFKGIYRLPPGRMLMLDNGGNMMVKNYLNQFKGFPVNYNVFKEALNATISSIISDSPAKKDVVLLSGGIDSSVLLGAIRKLKTDVTALTMSIKPCFNVNALDVARSKEITKKIGVEQEFVDIDFGDVDCSYLEKIIPAMPLAAHLSINFLKTFESLASKQASKSVRIWCGQNCDTLYNLGPTSRFSFIHRFLISTPYLKMVEGVKESRKFKMMKSMIDLIIRTYYMVRYKRIYQPPKNVYELIKYFNESDQYLALSLGSQESNYNGRKNQDVNISEASRMLFDEKLGSFFTGRDHKVVIHSAKIFNLDVVLPYSRANMVQLFRNLDRGCMDVLFPKRFLYLYAEKELNLPTSFFYRGVSAKTSCVDFVTWENLIMTATEFGSEVKKVAEKVVKCIGKNTEKTLNLQNIIGLYWVNTIHEKLQDCGIGVEWPLQNKQVDSQNYR